MQHQKAGPAYHVVSKMSWHFLAVFCRQKCQVILETACISTVDGVRRKGDLFLGLLGRLPSERASLWTLVAADKDYFGGWGGNSCLNRFQCKQCRLGLRPYHLRSEDAA